MDQFPGWIVNVLQVQDASSVSTWFLPLHVSLNSTIPNPHFWMFWPDTDVISSPCVHSMMTQDHHDEVDTSSE